MQSTNERKRLTLRYTIVKFQNIRYKENIGKPFKNNQSDTTEAIMLINLEGRQE